MKEILEGVILGGILVLTLAASIRMGLEGYFKFPESKHWDILTSRNWSYALFVLLPGPVIAFARGEISPFPWVAFREEYWLHGLFSGLFAASNILLVDLWIFWIPANIWINKQYDLENNQKTMAHLINLLGGLLLVTFDNPVYKLISLFSE